MDTLQDIQFLDRSLRDLCGVSDGARILDFGCGAGGAVKQLQSLGFDAWGCDNGLFRQGDYQPNEQMLEITPAPYRLPFDDSFFDAVISTSVMEHAQNKEELFREIHRVLKPGATMMHVMPGKYYLPTEPHIYVPFVSWMWPNVPRLWLALWAMAGCRNEFQRGLDWQETCSRNVIYCKTGLSYWPHRRFKKVVTAIFGECRFADDYYVRNATGGAARLARKIPLPHKVTGWLVGRTRMGILIATK